MRKIVAFLFVSVDGVVGDAADWLALSEDVAAMVTARTASADTILLGRATYEKFAAEWPHRSGPIADFLNTTPKVVVSTSLDEVSWQNTTLLDGNALIGEELLRLRHAMGEDIVVLGSATLVQSLIRRAMIDELVLLVHPVIKARGRRLFDELKEDARMQRVECTAYEGGLVSLSYQMTPQPSHGLIAFEDPHAYASQNRVWARSGDRGLDRGLDGGGPWAVARPAAWSSVRTRL